MSGFILPLIFNLRKHWKLLFGGGAFLALLIYAGIQKLNASHWHKKYDREAAQHLKDNQTWTAAQIEANARATAEKAATEARYARIQKDQAHALTLARADADARLRNWMRTHRAGQGAAGQTDLPDNPGSAPGPDAVSGETFMVAAHDLELCTAAVVKLEGWQSWWAEIEKAQQK